MRVAVSAMGKGLKSKVDVRFGRCTNFVIAEVEGTEIKEVRNVKNTASKQMGGAGITSSELVARQGAKAVITGNIGPRAMSVFKEFAIEVYHGEGTVGEALKKFANNQLRELSDPTGPMFMGKPAGIAKEHKRK